MTPADIERAAQALDQLGELIDQLASNAREFDYHTANRMERDAAKALLTIEAAVNALPELLAENERLREESAANRRLLRLYAIQHGTVTET